MNVPADLGAQLRRHFRSAANDQPAGGQLGAVLDRIAATRQRPAWTLPERWLPMQPVTGTIAVRPPLARRAAGVVVLLLLILALAATALIAGGRPLQRDVDEIVTQRGFVVPFIGLPPEGTTPSSPETGQLLLSFYGRMNITEDVHGIWVYADGRIIWRRSLDSHVTPEARRRGFGVAEPTRAVIEQRLTPEGVELLRSEAISTGLSGLRPGRSCPGPVYWAVLAVRVGDDLVSDAWCNPESAGRLAEFASWLPASAWADQRIGGYVPYRYGVCTDPTVVDQLPEAIRNLLQSRATPITQPDSDPGCVYEVTTDDARAIAAALDEAGFERGGFDVSRVLQYRIPDDRVPGA